MSATGYTFEKFVVDGVDVLQNPTEVTMNKDISVVAYYHEENNMGTVVFSGVVSAQAAAGEIVTVTVTKPGGSKATVTAPTNANKVYSVNYTDVALAGTYSAVASIPESSDANTIYDPATSPVKTFTIDKVHVSRTITLDVA